MTPLVALNKIKLTHESFPQHAPRPCCPPGAPVHQRIARAPTALSHRVGGRRDDGSRPTAPQVGPPHPRPDAHQHWMIQSLKPLSFAPGRKLFLRFPPQFYKLVDFAWKVSFAFHRGHKSPYSMHLPQLPPTIIFMFDLCSWLNSFYTWPKRP